MVERDSAGTCKVKVKEPAQEGRANQAVTVLLAEWLQVPRRAVRVVHGLGSRDKQVEVEGLGIEEVEARIEAALAGPPRSARERKRRDDIV